jgi:hypothetical protein
MFVCGIPKDSDEFSRVLTVEQKLFGGLSIPSTVAHEFFKFRPEIFTAVAIRGGTVAAYSSAYPLQRRWAQALIAGDITEPELTPEMLLRRQDCHEDSHVYIGSVVIDGGHDPLTKTILLSSLLSWRAQQMRDASIKRLSVVMTGVTKQGERLIHYVGAKQLNDGANRRDGYPIYGRKITPGFLHRATTVIERCLNSQIVEMNLDFRPSV